MFIDTVKIYVRSGDGGRGCRSFYRDKYKREGTPDGGDGGKGADVVIRADRNLHTLLDYKYNQHFYGKNGENGSGKRKKGRDAQAMVIRVPCGTLIKNSKTGALLRDLKDDQDEVVAARGGTGGRGNRHRLEATDGEAGEEKEIVLDLHLIADVGVVGFPNAGKSTLIQAVSNAQPKIAAYPFTTKFPVLGVVRRIGAQFIIADLPGLIEGASRGRGLGDRFLKHIERTRILIHLVDISGTQGRNPLDDYRSINSELRNYGKGIHNKPQVIALNKIDLEDAGENLEIFKKTVKKKVYPISALNKEGLEELLDAVRKKIQKNRN